MKKVIVNGSSLKEKNYVRLIYLNGRPLGYLKSIKYDRDSWMVLTSDPASARKYAGSVGRSSESDLALQYQFIDRGVDINFIQIIQQYEEEDQREELVTRFKYDPQKSLVVYLPQSECKLSDDRLDYRDCEVITVNTSYLRSLSQDYVES